MVPYAHWCASIWLSTRFQLFAGVCWGVALLGHLITLGLPRWCSGEESAGECRRHKRHGFDTWVRKIPWSRKWQSTPVSLPGESHGQRGLVGYSPWVAKSRTRLSTHACSNSVLLLEEPANCFPKDFTILHSCQLCVRLAIFAHLSNTVSKYSYNYLCISDQ